MPSETDPVKQKDMSEKIFKALDVDHDESFDKKEMINLVEAFLKVIPFQMRRMTTQFGMS
jgi:hypothetical protein